MEKNAPASGSLTNFPGEQFRWGRDWNGYVVDYNAYDYITFYIGSNMNDEIKKLYQLKGLYKLPVFYAYVIGFEARNFVPPLENCYVSQVNSLCDKGAEFIRSHKDVIIEKYERISNEFSKVIGPLSTAIFLIEPDFWLKKKQVFVKFWWSFQFKKKEKNIQIISHFLF
jgi:hypothetical protein